MNYTEFLQSKVKNIADAGFSISSKQLNKNLFDFEKYIVCEALRKGRYAIFANTGMGKTIMQLEWAYQVVKHTDKPVLILCPLAVSGQTIKEGEKFGIKVERYSGQTSKGIYILNYEQLDKIDCTIFIGIVLDESSILKNYTGEYKKLIISTFESTPYKLACTATPAPNDLNEIGNHSEFLNVLDSADMRQRWFMRDESINNYRLKRYAKKDFYGWMRSWSIVISNPADIGFDGSKYILPELRYHEKMVITAKRQPDKLFNDISVNATNFNTELRNTKTERLNYAAEIVNNSDEPFIIWIKQNEEGEYLRNLIPGAIEVTGSEKNETKEQKLLDFADNKFRVLITKSKIAGFGMNFQNCNNQVFASLDFSFEMLYQSVRRSYRFGQSKVVNIYIITTDTMQNVISSIKKKEEQFKELQEEMNKSINGKDYRLKMDYTRRETKNEYFTLINGDSVAEIESIQDDSLDFAVFSPPFSNLYTYSDSLRDMGNCVDDKEFFKQYQFLLKKLYRKIKPGRLIAVHTKDLARYKNSAGYTGLYDFTGDNHRAVEKAGFKYHSKITIWTDPVLEMQRTKTQRLLYKQVTGDSTYSGTGLAEYITIFRKWDGNEDDWEPVMNLTKNNFSLETWQKWASPVWMDIKRTDVLNNREGTDFNDEKHICPLQLSVIERCIALWTNEGETVFSPFAGIGSEGYQAIKMNRKFIGIELKESYYDTALRNLNSIIEQRNQLNLAI
jgi:DNA modification methylase/superfamily II DNA or RNA helicase